jgi:hypothetical protein
MTAQSIAVRRADRTRIAAMTCLLALTLTGCFDDGKSGHAGEPAGSSANPPAAPNRAPTISGTPPTSATVNEPYVFQPAANDPDGDSLTFTIANKPAWAAFDPATGRLSGTPSSSSTGTFANIGITVSDRKATGNLGAFSISVTGGQLGSATLSWQPPTSNTDGSPLIDLAGYVIRYGTIVGQLTTEVRLSNPGLTTYMVSDLTPATWYFQISAYNASGVESTPSEPASKTIS